MTIPSNLDELTPVWLSQALDTDVSAVEVIDRFFAALEVDPNDITGTVNIFEQVCFDFPELTIVMRQGSEPWQELAVKQLHLMPSSFTPKYYPKAIIDYANTRGADRIMYAGYYPMGLSLRRIFDELPDVPFKDEVWPKFLPDNAMRVFKLEAMA